MSAAAGASGRGASPREVDSGDVPASAMTPEPRLQRRGFSKLPGWAEDDALLAFRIFRAGAAHRLAGGAELRAGKAPTPEFVELGRAAMASRPSTQAQARGFFEAHCSPHEILPQPQAPFFTGYFEPEVDGARQRGDAFRAPILARPADLATLPQGGTLPGAEPPLPSARSRAGRLVPCPDRGAILDGALDGEGLALVWLRDEVEVFIVQVQVQGSARVRLPGGDLVRLRYAGRNGWPYRSIGRLLIAKGAIPEAEMSLEALTGWLRAHPEEGRAVMRHNPSYVFFALDETLSPDDGPVGGAGLALAEGRSIAVDRGIWPYGLPFFVDVERPEPGGGWGRWRRLMLAQDTGAAMLGAGRADLFFGSGVEAGSLAGRQRHHGRLFVLLPARGPHAG